MAIIGLGTDIVDIERIEKVLARNGEAFAMRILTETELAHFKQLKQRNRYLAKRFAAKEAAAKALGTGIAQGVSFQDFIIENDSLGKPCLNFAGEAVRIAQLLGVSNIHLSISDERLYAVATVILES